MMYCERCMRLVEGARCPICRGKAREPSAEDFCLVEEMNGVRAGIYEDVLRQEKIPCVTRQQGGAWITAVIGSGIGVTEFYVPYSRMDDAKLLEKELFESGTLEDEAEAEAEPEGADSATGKPSGDD